MNTSITHPLGGNICHIITVFGNEAILSEYFLTTRRKIMKKKTDTTKVISSNHHRSSDFISI
jgi:hypothetical protein